MAFDTDRTQLNQALKRGILALHYREDLSYTEIGRRAGYPNGDVICKIKAHDPHDPDSPPPVLPDLLKCLRLSGLFSEYGYDEVADLFSCAAKINLPVLGGTESDRWKPNRDVRPEVAGVTMGTGTFQRHILAGRFQEARQCLREGFRELRRCWGELEEIEVRGLPGRFDACTSGDSLPAPAQLSA